MTTNIPNTISRKLEIGDAINFQNQICYVSSLNKKTTLRFYSKESNSIRYFQIRTTDEKFNVITNTDDVFSEELKDDYKKMFTVFKKGDFVSFLNKVSKVEYGTVIKNNKNDKKLTVALTDGVQEVEASYALFTKEKKPTIKIPELLKDWSCVSYKENKLLSSGTINFTTFVKYKNKKVFVALNRGDGGVMDTEWADSNVNGYEYSNKLEKLVKQSIIDLYPNEDERPSLYDALEDYILWYNRDRKLNISWEDKLKNDMKLKDFYPQ